MSIPFKYQSHKSHFNFVTDLYQKTVKQDSQHSHESGFQSATSLNSLEGGPKEYSPPTSHIKASPPGSTVTGSTENDRNLSNRRLNSADSYGSLASTYLPQRSSIIKEDLFR